MSKLIIEILVDCKSRICRILEQIEEVGINTDNNELREYLLYPHNEYYLYNIHDVDLLDYLHLSSDEKEVIDHVYDISVGSECLYLISNIIDDLYNHYNDNEDDKISSLLSNLQVDLEQNLLSAPNSIDEVIKELRG